MQKKKKNTHLQIFVKVQSTSWSRKRIQAQTSQIFCDETNVVSLGGGDTMQQSTVSVPTGVPAAHVSVNMLLQSSGYTQIYFQTLFISLIPGVSRPSLSSHTWRRGEESEERCPETSDYTCWAVPRVQLGPVLVGTIQNVGFPFKETILLIHWKEPWQNPMIYFIIKVQIDIRI